MGPWFYHFITYLILVVFCFTTGPTENPSLTAHVPEEVPQTWPTFYCLPRAPFGPLHFSDYPIKTEYKKLTLDNIICFDRLVQQRTSQTVFYKGAWYKHPAVLFCKKYNYLPSFQTDMKALPTSKPDCLSPSPDPSPLITSQYAGIAYITLAGLVDTMVPSTRPWALVDQLASYLIKLAPLLWWALSSSKQSKLATKTDVIWLIQYD
ncbi:hypothetical protein DSO57_1010393 [Entomophthora muscae]|uniref:Uncharacterized protein n=1 Tax=Entomophthora muscae TaxID=34485 RepID=A0ACC2RL70_9FUNG|nr:hypothetical protein DSO57_1010393 [Entomophthora muscae]